MAREFLQVDEFRRRAKAGEFVSGKDAGVGVQVALTATAAIDVESREATYDISDATVDRSKDILEPDGGTFDNYQRNPVFLWAHDYGLLPIGKCVKGPWVEDGKVKATFRYHDASKSPIAEMIWQQVLDGTLRAVSIGFVPIKWAFNEDRGLGIDFDEWELIEVSQVPVPCNPNALLDDGKGIAQLEAFVKDLRAQTDARRKSKEQTMPSDTKKFTLTVELKAEGAEKAIAEIERKARNAGALEVKSAATAQDDEADDSAHEQMADHTKALGEHVKAFGALHKDYTAGMKGIADAQDEAQAHAKAMGAMVDAMGEALAQGDGKGFAAELAKALKAAPGAPGSDALSKNQMGHIKSIAKHANAAISAHHDAQGAVDGEPGKDDKPDDSGKDDDGDEDSDSKAADPVTRAATAEAKRLGCTPAEVISAWTKRAMAQAQGRLD